MVFIDLPITLLRFSILRYHIIQGFSVLPVMGCKADGFFATNEQERLYENKKLAVRSFSGALLSCGVQLRGEIDG